MCRELASFIRYTLSVSLFSGLDERLASYAQKMEFLPTSIGQDFESRNGYFYRYAKMAGTRVNPAGIKVEIPDDASAYGVPQRGGRAWRDPAVAARFGVAGSSW